MENKEEGKEEKGKSNFRNELKDITNRRIEKKLQERKRMERFNTLFQLELPCILEQLKNQAEEGYFLFQLPSSNTIFPYLTDPQVQNVFTKKMEEYNLTVEFRGERNLNFNYSPNVYIKWE